MIQLEDEFIVEEVDTRVNSALLCDPCREMRKVLLVFTFTTFLKSKWLGNVNISLASRILTAMHLFPCDASKELSKYSCFAIRSSFY